jgi:hypothetical protein
MKKTAKPTRWPGHVISRQKFKEALSEIVERGKLLRGDRVKDISIVQLERPSNGDSVITIFIRNGTDFPGLIIEGDLWGDWRGTQRS